MKYRIFFKQVALLLLTVGLFPTHAADHKHVVLIQTMPVPPVLNQSEAFVKHLAALGYVAEDNLRLIRLHPEGDRARAEYMLQQVLRTGRPDLVVTSATMASQAAQKLLQGTGIPQLFFTVSDPVGAGLISGVGIPSGANITGKVHTVAREAKIRMALRVVGGRFPRRPLRFGFIHSDYPSSMGDARLLKAAAQATGAVRFVFYQLPYRPVPEGLPAMLADVQQGIAALESKVDFWWEPSGPLGERDEYTRLLRDRSRHAILFGTNMDSVRLGALLHVTPNEDVTGREAAQLAVAILRGQSPADFPVTPPADFDLGINLATALRLQVAIASDLVELAGDYLFHEQAP